MSAAAAIARWRDAVNQRGAPAALAAAVVPDVVVECHAPAHPGETPGALAERMVGVAAVAAWLARTHPDVTFALPDPPRPADDARWRVRYQLAAGDFANEGTWEVALADDGRLAVVVHRPRALPAAPPPDEPEIPR
ncbi:MAG: hypothetical protein R2939_02565 [Kofleriaceae bacterium]